MFAVLKTGGKQYKVAANDIFLVEKLPAEAGETVRFTEILMLGGDTVTIRPSCGGPAAGGGVGAIGAGRGGGSCGRCIRTTSWRSPLRHGESRNATSWPLLSVQR